MKGHEQGDSLIKSAADCIKGVLRKNDVVARIGGDEFAILGIECDKSGCEAIFNNVTSISIKRNQRFCW
jgi:diguanylate cyclase (GGDEF)-like protein